MIGGEKKITLNALGNLRNEIARRQNLIKNARKIQEILSFSVTKLNLSVNYFLRYFIIKLALFCQKQKI